MDAVGQQCAEIKRCYQSTKKLLQENTKEEVTTSRADLSYMASAVISDLGDVAATLRERLRSTSEDEVAVPRIALMALMKSVAKWLTTNLRERASTYDSDSNQKPSDDSVKQPKNEIKTIASTPEATRWQGRVLVVGAGATGSCVALRLRTKLGKDARIVIWEKARGAGGRMSTNRQDSINVRADMGAPYLSLDGDDADCKGAADMLVQTGVCADASSEWLSRTPERPSDRGWRHLAGVQGGVNDALKKIIEEAKAEVVFEQRVASIDQQGDRWRAKPFSGSACDFDAVILAVPGCGVGGDNLNKIHGGWERSISAEQNKQLLGVQHDQRWAFALFFPMDVASSCDAFFGSKGIEQIVDDNTIHLLCYQTRKTARVGGPVAKGGIAIVAHTTTEWARRNSRANGRDQRLLDEVAERVKKIIGLNRTRLLASKVITWKQCHVTRPIPASSPESPCMLISSDPPLILAGDYFTASNFGGCLKSGFAAADLLANLLTSASGGSDNRGKRKSFDSDDNRWRKRGRNAW